MNAQTDWLHNGQSSEKNCNLAICLKGKNQCFLKFFRTKKSSKGLDKEKLSKNVVDTTNCNFRIDIQTVEKESFIAICRPHTELKREKFSNFKCVFEWLHDYLKTKINVF